MEASPVLSPGSSCGTIDPHMCCYRLGVIVAGLVVVAGTLFAQTPGGVPSAELKGEAYRLFLMGRHLEGEGDLEGAIRAHSEAAELDPSSGEVLAELAALYARRSRSKEAIASARLALGRDPDNQTAHRVLGLVYASRSRSRGANPEGVAQAIEHLEQARGTPRPDFQVELTLAHLYLSTDATGKAIAFLEELLRDEAGFAEAGLLLSQAYEKAGRLQDALTTLEAAVEGERPSYRTLVRLGELYAREERWRDAVRAYERAVARNARSTRVRRRLASALLEFGDTKRARDVLRDLINIRPRDASGLYLLSQVELDLNNFDEAETAARRLLKLEPEGLRGPFALAQVFGRRREHRNVIETLEPALRAARQQNARPEQLASLMARLGFAYQQLDEHNLATAVYTEAVELMPSSLAFAARLARVYIDDERLDDAMRAIVRAKIQHPDNLTLARLEAQVLTGQDDIAQATSVLERALAMHGDEPMAHVALATFYSEQDRFDDAVTLLRSAEQRFPNDAAVLFQLGAVLEQHDRFVDAERAFRRLLDRYPEHAGALNYLGYMLADRGVRLEESVALLERAIKKDPHNGSYLDSLGWAYFKLERLDLAEPPLRAASDQLRSNSVVQDHLGDLLYKLERYAEAIEAWERALVGEGDEIEPTMIERKIDDAKGRVGY